MSYTNPAYLQNPQVPQTQPQPNSYNNNQIPPYVPGPLGAVKVVSYGPDVVVFGIIIMIGFAITFANRNSKREKISSNGIVLDDKSESESTDSLQIKNLFAGFLFSAIAACIAALVFHQLRWNFANPVYAAMNSAMNYNNNRYYSSSLF